MSHDAKEHDFYEDQYWPKLIDYLKAALRAGSERDQKKQLVHTCVLIDIGEIGEAVLGVGLSPTRLERDLIEGKITLTPRQYKKLQDTRSRNKAHLIEVINDTLTLEEIDDEFGTWVLAEHEDNEYLLVNMDAQRILRV